MEGVEYRESLKPLLEDLPPRERRILLLRFFGNMTQSQIAQEVGISQMHVSRLLARTLAQLREKLLVEGDVLSDDKPLHEPPASPRCRAHLTLLDDDPRVGIPLRVMVKLVTGAAHPWARPGARPSLDIAAVPLSSAEVVPATALYGPGDVESVLFRVTAPEPGQHRIRFTFCTTKPVSSSNRWRRIWTSRVPNPLGPERAEHGRSGGGPDPVPRTLTTQVIQDPSDGFRFLPHLETEPPDLRVSFDVLGGGRIRARMSGTSVPALKGTEHKADLSARPDEVHGAAARLCARWKERFVDFQPVDDRGRALPDRRRPYANTADLSAEPEDELRAVVADLARGGESLLFDTLLRGDDVRTEMFRTYLRAALSREGLRVRFDSDLYLPWTLLSSDGGAAANLDGLFARFLGTVIRSSTRATPTLGSDRPLRYRSSLPSV